MQICTGACVILLIFLSVSACGQTLSASEPVSEQIRHTTDLAVANSSPAYVSNIEPWFILTTGNTLTITGFWGQDLSEQNATVVGVSFCNENATILTQTNSVLLVKAGPVSLSICAELVVCACEIYIHTTVAIIQTQFVLTPVVPATSVLQLFPMQVMNNAPVITMNLNGGGWVSLLNEQLEFNGIALSLPRNLSVGTYFPSVFNSVETFLSTIPIVVVDSCAGLLSPIACNRYSQCHWCASTAQCLPSETNCSSIQSCPVCLGTSSANVWCPGTQICQQSFDNCVNGMTSACAPPSIVYCGTINPFGMISSCSEMRSQYVGFSTDDFNYEYQVGWCWDTNICMNGNLNGPFIGQCRQWQYVSVPCNGVFPWTTFAITISLVSFLFIMLSIFFCFWRRTNWIQLNIPKTFHRVIMRQRFTIFVSRYGLYCSFLVKKVFNIVTFGILVFPFSLNVSNVTPFTSGIVVMMVMLYNLGVVLWLTAAITGYVSRIPRQASFILSTLILTLLEVAAFIVMLISIIPFTLIPANPRTELNNGIDYGQVISIAISGFTSISSHLFAVQMYRTVRNYHLFIASATQHLLSFTTDEELANVVDTTFSTAVKSAQVIYGVGEHISFQLKRILNLFVGISSVMSLYNILTSGFTNNLFDKSLVLRGFIGCGIVLCAPLIMGFVVSAVFRSSARFSIQRFNYLRIFLLSLCVFCVLLQIGGLVIPIVLFHNITVPYFVLVPNISSAVIAVTADILCLAYVWSYMERAKLVIVY